MRRGEVHFLVPILRPLEKEIVLIIIIIILCNTFFFPPPPCQLFIVAETELELFLFLSKNNCIKIVKVSPIILDSL